MGLFKPKPGLPDYEKARIEYHLQQLAECIGFDLLKNEFFIPEQTLASDPAELNSETILKLLGEHLRYDVTPVTVLSKPTPLEKCGGGG